MFGIVGKDWECLEPLFLVKPGTMTTVTDITASHGKWCCGDVNSICKAARPGVSALLDPLGLYHYREGCLANADRPSRHSQAPGQPSASKAGTRLPELVVDHWTDMPCGTQLAYKILFTNQGSELQGLGSFLWRPGLRTQMALQAF